MAEVEEGVMGCISQPTVSQGALSYAFQRKNKRISLVVLTSRLDASRCAFSLRGKGKCPSVCYRAGRIMRVSWLLFFFKFQDPVRDVE